MFRHKFRRLLREHRVGPHGGQSAEMREILSVLFRTLSRHQVQHHDPTKNTVLHNQSHSAVRRNLLGDCTAVLHAGELRREDNDGHDNPHVSHHLLAARRRDQPFHVARNSAYRQISAVHNVPRLIFYSYNRSGA